MLTTFLLAVICSAPAQADLSRKITFETPDVRIGTALSELGQVANVALSHSPMLADEYLLLALTDAPLKDVLDRIAEATHAEWQSEKEGYRLIRSAKLQRDLEQLHLRSEAARFQKAIDKVKSANEKQEDLDQAAAKGVAGQIRAMMADLKEKRGQMDNYRAYDSLRKSLPGNRLAARIAVLLDPRELGSIVDPGKIVFATNPNRMQRPLPAGVVPVIERYVREREVLKPHVENLIGEDTAPGIDWAVYTLLRNAKAKDTKPAKVLVEVRTWEFASNAMVTVKLANAAGRILENASCSLDVQESMGPQPGPQEKDPTGQSPLALSQRSQDLAQAIQEAMGQRDDFTFEMPQSIRPVVLEPENHTFAELSCSDLFLGAAKANRVNVVAAPSDVFGFFTSVLFVGGPPSANQFLARLRQPLFDMELRESPGWVVLRAIDPVKSRRQLMDRFRLGKLVRSAAANGRLGIDDVADFAASTPEGFERNAAMIYLMLANSSVGRTFERASWQLYRFHGLLSPEQRKAFVAGQSLSYGVLSPAQQRIFHKFVFEDHDGMSQTRTATHAPGTPRDAEEGEDSESLKWEPTERYPNGLGPQSSISLKDSSGHRISAKGTHMGQYSTSGEMEVEELASFLVSREDPTNTWAQNTVYTEFSFINLRKLDYTFLPDREYMIGGSLQETLESSKPVSTVDKLPPDVYRSLQEAMARFRDAARNRKPPPPTVR